jgi:type IV pilus assembly protein PilM
MRAHRILVADAGAGHLACGLFALDAGGGLRLEQFAWEPLVADPAQEAHWAEQAGRALAAIADREKLGGAVTLAVPGHLALTKFIKTPAVEKTKREKIIHFEATQNIPYALEEVVWDHLVVSDDGLDLEIMLSAVKADAIGALCEAAGAAGFAAEAATPSCLALCRSFRHNYPESAAPVLVANVGARSTNLLFIEPGRFYVRTLALAGNAVTQTIADELHLEFAQAETLKIQVLSGHSDLPAASPSRAAVQRAAAGFSSRLQLEITRSTANFRRTTNAGQPARIYVTGGGALIAELPATLAAGTGLPTERFDALRHVEVAPRAAGAAAQKDRLADLVGLATRLTAKDAAVSLLPATLGSEIEVRRRQPWWLGAAALAVLALLPPIWHYHRLTAATQARIDSLEAELRPLRSLQSRNADNLAKIAEARRQVAAIHGLVETKSNWITFFSDLQSRLTKVEDVWLERLAVGRATAPANGAEGAAELRLTLSGRLLDAQHPVSKVSADSYERVKKLLASFAGSQFIASVENERFDNSQPGILRFDFTLVVNPAKPL